MYKDLGLQKNQIYIVSKKSSNSRNTSKKLSAADYVVSMDCVVLTVYVVCPQALTEGYPSHLQDLRMVPPRMATVDMRPLTSYQCFVPHSRKPSSSSKQRSKTMSSSSSKKVHVLESAI